MISVPRISCGHQQRNFNVVCSLFRLIHFKPFILILAYFGLQFSLIWQTFAAFCAIQFEPSWHSLSLVGIFCSLCGIQFEPSWHSLQPLWHTVKPIWFVYLQPILAYNFNCGWLSEGRHKWLVAVCTCYSSWIA